MSDVDIRREKLVKQFKFGGLALALLLQGLLSLVALSW